MPAGHTCSVVADLGGAGALVAGAHIYIEDTGSRELNQAAADWVLRQIK